MYRVAGCELLQEMGILLRLPQVVCATAQTLLHRFYYRKSLAQFDVHIVAIAALFLGAKVEEVPRRMRDVLNVAYHCKLRRQGKPSRPIVLGGNLYARWKAELIRTERIILKELGFSMYAIMDHPHKGILYYAKALGGSSLLAQFAWSYLNDSLRLDLCVRYNAESIACAAIFLAARRIGMALPKETPWFEIFNTRKADMLNIAEEILGLYERPRATWLPSLRPGARPGEDDDEGEPATVSVQVDDRRRPPFAAPGDDEPMISSVPVAAVP